MKLPQRTALVVVVAIAVVAAGLGWIAGRGIRSPAEAAANRRPPDPSLITVPVEERTLSSSVIVRGDVAFSDATDVTVLATTPDGVAIVTGLPKTSGDEVAEGDVLLEVAGRPVIALAGDLPVYRNLGPGSEGPDVRQLEEALLRLGLDPGDADGRFDQRTEDAVAALYVRAGHPAPGPADEDAARLTGARDVVATATAQVRAMESQLSSQLGGAPASARLDAQGAVDDARNALDLAEMQGQQANAAAMADRDAARHAHAAAEADLAAADTPANRAAVATTTANLANAESQIGIVATEHSGNVARARNALAAAEARLRETVAPADTSEIRAALDAARADLARAQSELADLDAAIGTRFPAAELVFVPQLPATVQRVDVERGAIPTGPVLTISSSSVLIRSGVSAADRALVEVGQTATITDETTGLDTTATVASIADEPGGPGLGDDRYALVLTPDAALGEETYGANVRIDIPVESTGGEVLAVPFAALSAGAAGDARVEVARDGETTELVTVVVGLRAQGLVEVRPVDGALAAGDRVVVGRDLSLPGGVTVPPGPDDAPDGPS